MKNSVLGLFALASAFILSGCVVRTYPVVKERVNQELTGNRGYIQGQPPAVEEQPRKKTRTIQVVEIEFHSPIRFEMMKQAPEAKAQPEAAPAAEGTSVTEGNRGYITQAPSLQVAAPQMQKYTVQKGDTLQKISKRFYNTTRRWMKIYDANKDVLSGPDKVYPGMTLNIPVTPEMKNAAGPLNKPGENLK